MPDQLTESMATMTDCKKLVYFFYVSMYPVSVFQYLQISVLVIAVLVPAQAGQ